MKILTLADLHYNMRQFDWLLECAGEFDMVILAGDLLNIAGHVDLDTQVLVVRKILQRLAQKTRLLVCSGNHDLDHQNDEGEYFADWLKDGSLGAVRGDGGSLDLEGWRFSLCPWWDGPTGRENVTAFLEKEAGKDAGNWFVIHHAPPSETRTAWSGKRDFGDKPLREFIEHASPTIVLSGHVHQAPFRQEHGWYDRIGSTWIFNAGYQMGSLPPCLVFDLEAMEVTWTSLAGQETCSLNSE